MHQVEARRVPLRQREIRGEDIAAHYSEFAPTAPMSAEREKALVAAMKKGDQDAREALIRQHARVGISMALRYASRKRYEGLDVGELVGAALLGVVEGVDHYDPNRGSRMSTCVYLWVRTQLQRSRRFQRFISLPNGRSGRGTVTYAIDSYLVGCPDGEPGAAAWSDEFCPLHQEDVHEETARREELEILNDAIDSLTEKEADVIRGRMNDETLDEIGKRHNLSRERIRQIETQVMKKLEATLKEKLTP